jgi:two-component system, LuxR family, sensor kinase FixL
LPCFPVERFIMKNEPFLNQFHILENILHGVIITDLRGHIIFWNSANEKILGYQRSEIIERPVRMLYADDEEMPFKKILKECVDGKMVHGIWHASHKNGRKVWLDIRAKIHTDAHEKPIYCVITICDIGKLKFTEGRLKKNLAISQAIFDTSVDAMITINKKGIIETTNRSAMQMFGYKKYELVGESVNILMPFPHNHNHDDYILNYLNTGEKKIIGKEREVHGIKKDGTVFPIELVISEVTWEDHKVFAGIIRDLTERRKLEKRILEIGNEERQQIGRELHDGLGQMLTGIRMLSENLARKLKVNSLPGSEEVEEISKMIRDADEYARTLSRGMVLVELEKNGLSVSLENLCRRTSRLAGINCEFRVFGNIDIESDTMSQHLYRIAQESLSNALKHGNAKNITVWLSSNDHHTSLIIDDDGKGFDIIEVEHTEQGAGLLIMKHRARVMGGILDLIRTEQGLTRIRCVIPNNMEHFQ